MMLLFRVPSCGAVPYIDIFIYILHLLIYIYIYAVGSYVTSDIVCIIIPCVYILMGFGVHCSFEPKHL